MGWLTLSQNSHGVAALMSGGKKRRREQMDGGPQPPRARAPKFGETNDAPPSLSIGGQLAKQVSAARALAAKAAHEAAIARQRASAVESYKAAKAARRQASGPRS